MNIVPFGEALIDFKATRPLAFQGFVGGSPLNVAVAVARLGVPAGLASQVSNDLFGGYIRNHLQGNGVSLELLERSDAPSTLAFVEERGGEAHFTFLSNGAADTLYDPEPRPELPDEVAFIEFGSISLLTEPASSAITDTVAKHRGRCAVVFDPNVRPALTEDKERFLEGLQRHLTLSHIVKVSTQDLAWLYPNQSTREVVEAWLGRGPEAVLVTQGEGGVRLFRRGEEPLEVRAPEVDTVDTVGAGDTLTGALMVGLLERGYTRAFGEISESDWREILTFATAAAALNCTREGADPPRRDELERFLKGS